MDAKLQELKAKLLEINDIGNAAAVLHWDQATYMPEKGAAARGRQLATLGKLAQTMAISPEIGTLLDELTLLEEERGFEDDDASLVRVARRNFEDSQKIPPELTGRFMSHSAESYQVWAKARPENDFKMIEPYLEKTVELSREVANCFPGYDHIADPLIDFADFGMKAESVRAVFADLRAELVPMVEKITAQDIPDDGCLRQRFPQEKQRKFGEMVIKEYGYDFSRGRQDLTHHPFMTSFSINDVRITTRYDEDFLVDGLFSTLHEAGHALYELGIDQRFEGSPLAGGTSAGVHESQSRLWENIVGRSRGFWEHFYPQLQAEFPEQMGNVSLDTFYRAINKVEKSLIRVDADELTYNLHVMIRFELALQLLEGSLAVKDLPDAWHARYESDLGVRAPSDVDGCLQDVHWYAGLVGGSFQGYTLGNVMSGAFYEKVLEAHPEIPSEIASGKFGTLHGWLKENIYRPGSKYTAPELVQRVTGSELRIEPYISYLKGKYGELYEL